MGHRHSNTLESMENIGGHLVIVHSTYFRNFLLIDFDHLTFMSVTDVMSTIKHTMGKYLGKKL